MKRLKVLVSLFLCFCIPDLCQSQQEQFAGPYRLVLHQIEQCDVVGTKIYPNSTRINKVSRNKYIYTTNVTTEITIDDGVSIDVDFAVFGNGGWRPHFLQMEFPKACTSTKQMMPVLYDVITETIKTECPIPPGTYEIVIDMENIKVLSSLPNFPYGKYRADLNGRINGTLLGCVRNYVDVVPLKKAKPKRPKHNP